MDDSKGGHIRGGKDLMCVDHCNFKIILIQFQVCCRFCYTILFFLSPFRDNKTH